jgi:hypothetical protein
MSQGGPKLSTLEERSPAPAVEEETSPGRLHDVIRRRHEHDQIASAVVEGISADGIARVILRGETEACEASSLVQFPSAAAASKALVGRTVLVLLNPPLPPVILGAVSQRVWNDEHPDAASEVQVKLPAADPVSVQVDKRRVDLEATDEIRLTCGKSSLVLRRDGTVVVRGVKIVSRATESNKIRGATVAIN